MGVRRNAQGEASPLGEPYGTNTTVKVLLCL